MMDGGEQFPNAAGTDETGAETLETPPIGDTLPQLGDSPDGPPEIHDEEPEIKTIPGFNASSRNSPVTNAEEPQDDFADFGSFGQQVEPPSQSETGDESPDAQIRLDHTVLFPPTTEISTTGVESAECPFAEFTTNSSGHNSTASPQIIATTAELELSESRKSPENIIEDNSTDDFADFDSFPAGPLQTWSPERPCPNATEDIPDTAQQATDGITVTTRESMVSNVSPQQDCGVSDDSRTAVEVSEETSPRLDSIPHQLTSSNQNDGNAEISTGEPSTTASEVQSNEPWADQAEGESGEFQANFGNFEADFDAFAPPPPPPEAVETSTAVAESCEDFDDFADFGDFNSGDFNSAQPAAKSQDFAHFNGEVSHKEDDFEDFSQPLSSNFESVSSVFECVANMCDYAPEDPARDPLLLQDFFSSISAGSEISRSIAEEAESAWSLVTDVSNSSTLSFQVPAESRLNQRLLCSLDVHPSNSLKQNLPKYAAQLGFLQPVRSSPGVLSATEDEETGGGGDTASNGPDSGAGVPDAQFDWRSSGLKNPLEARHQKEAQSFSLDFFDSQLKISTDPPVASDGLEEEFLSSNTEPKGSKSAPPPPAADSRLASILAAAQNSSRESSLPRRHTSVGVSETGARVARSFAAAVDEDTPPSSCLPRSASGSKWSSWLLRRK